MSLTITEKNHWKDRIEAKLNQKIKRIEINNQELIKSANLKAKQEVLKNKGVAQDYKKLTELTEKYFAVKEQANKLASELYEIIDGKSPWNSDTLEAVDRVIEHQAQHLDVDFLNQSEAGREIIKLREEKENLLDTVWLATSNRQIKELWSQVTDLLGEPPTLLQQQAIEKDPVQ